MATAAEVKEISDARDLRSQMDAVSEAIQMMEAEQIVHAAKVGELRKELERLDSCRNELTTLEDRIESLVYWQERLEKIDGLLKNTAEERWGVEHFFNISG